MSGLIEYNFLGKRNDVAFLTQLFPTIKLVRLFPKQKKTRDFVIILKSPQSQEYYFKSSEILYDGTTVSYVEVYQVVLHESLIPSK